MTKKIINGLIIIVTIAAMVIVWPAGLLMQEYSNRSDAGEYLESAYIKGEHTYIQTFVPEQGYLKSISIQISRDNTFQRGAEGTLTFSLYDEKDQLINSSTQELNTVINKDYQEFTIEKKVEKGSEHYFEVTAAGSESEGPAVRLIAKESNDLTENQLVIFGGEEYPQFSTIAVYTYGKLPGVLGTAAYYFLIWTISGILIGWNQRRKF